MTPVDTSFVGSLRAFRRGIVGAQAGKGVRFDTKRAQHAAPLQEI